MIHEHPHSILEGMNLQLLNTSDRYKRSLGKPLYALFAGVLLLLVIGCLNVSILLLARGAARERSAQAAGHDQETGHDQEEEIKRDDALAAAARAAALGIADRGRRGAAGGFLRMDGKVTGCGVR